ncbi:hypothetical protein AGABI1DRAFT_112600 [Agaricus bisporus var. burnettii JB137-S8]|uniref:TOG domain-containing protein n=1 Tax=Agaricus bisporus var. burnettii (strain JB137-S8 / ATCC MYA-4627 / FGSC 10392) TaxID=597362 RepID=K5XZK7_AGABU|nr:uncharacterized protein AGABI1DRAFT_112600 [Agaricus bisporus var. burnettii JB137-S8]EKM80885.1 hypothetical protein AGABI1DRAFT_112600 [Agaricus bisporus var. burnettii JB137-S8]
MDIFYNESLTLQDVVQSLEKIKPGLQLPETEESWERILKGLETLQKLCQSGACEYHEELTASIRSVHRNIVSAMNSERTRLSGPAIDVVNALALGLSTGFEPLMSLFLPSLIVLCGRANKVVVARAKACILSIIGITQLPGILLHLARFVKDKTPTIRLIVAEGTLQCLKCFNPPDLEKEVYAREVENIMRNAARDANADVRKVGKEIFETYKVLLPHKVDSFAAPLSPTIRKYLQLGTRSVQMQGKAPATTVPKGKIPAVMVPKAKSAVRPAPRPVTSKPETNVGPVRRARLPSTTNIPTKATSTETKVPLHPIQLPVKPTNGPQRVIRTNATALVSKSLGPSRSSSSSTGRQPVKKQLSSDTVRVNTASRSLSRPTLSQLARVKPPVVARPLSKSVSGLNVQKNKSASALATNASTHGHTSRAVGARNDRTDIIPCKRPVAPASIPLPPSPALTSSVTLPDVEPKLSNEALSHERAHSGESAGTPVAGSGRMAEVDLACKTPISTLLSSIQLGFDLTPCSPLSPPEHYVSSTLDSACQSSEFRLGVV